MPSRYSSRFVWLLSIVMIAGCGSASDPEADRRTIETFVADPAKGDEKAAREAADRMKKSSGPNAAPRDLLILAAYFDATGDSSNALDLLQRIPDDLPDRKTAAAARLSEGRIAFYRARKARRAETALMATTRLDPGSYLAWLPLADLYDTQNRRVERDACYSRLDEASALDRNRLVNWTCDRPLDSEAEEAAQVLQAFVASDSADVASAIALAGDKIRRGDFPGARGILDGIDSAADADAQRTMTLHRGLVDLETGEFDEATKRLESVDTSTMKPEEVCLRTRSIGRIQLQNRKYEEAETSLRKALSISPNDRESNQLLVQILRLTGRSAEAEPVSKRLSAIDRLEDLGQKVRASLRRDDPKTLREIADTAAEIGRYALAKAWLRQLLAKDPLNQQLQKEIYRIDQLAKGVK